MNHVWLVEWKLERDTYYQRMIFSTRQAATAYQYQLRDAARLIGADDEFSSTATEMEVKG